MHFSTSIVEAVTNDRLREAEAARLARGGGPEQAPKRRRVRRVRTLASRLVFAITR
jgi:hypothetical protein